MDERRRYPRSRTLKSGKIIFRHTSIIDCTVRNLTDHGALLLVGSLVGIPARFELQLDHARRNCRVIWRGSDRLGVEFA